MKIRMYNVGCGDCFCLRDRGRSLLVDFGTYNSRIDGHPRHEIFDVVISDLTTISHKNLLLSDFCLDHLSGFLYMMKSRRESDEFGRIYLPDVFSKEHMSRTLGLLLLSDLMKNTYLPSRQISLFALAGTLCRSRQKVTLLERGDEFEGRYQVLWPDREVIGKETEEVYQRIEKGHQEALKKLTGFGEKLRQAVYGMTDMAGDCQASHSTASLSTASFLEKELRELRSHPDFQQLLFDLDRENVSLRQFKNKISIVFQNARDGELNLLFTGNVSAKYMEMIAKNYDERLPLYDHYWCIKVPNHGIQADYFDFTSYSPENMLISNGIYYADRKKQAGAYRTSAQYAGLFYINDTHMYCSSSACCDGYRNGCTCKECDLISPFYYKDI